MSWLDRTIATIAERTGVDVTSVSPDPGARRALLEVARVASHTSGDRTNAPLLCYVLGAMTARGVALDDAIAIVNEVTGEAASN